MLTALLMLTALTAQAAEYGITINGQAVTDANKGDLVTAMPGAFTGGEAMYDSDAKTLVLTGATLSDGGNIPVIDVTQDELTIEVNGYCTIMASNGYGLQISGDAHVTLTGRGTLRVEGTTAVFLGNDSQTGYHTPKLTINGPMLDANGSSGRGICGHWQGGTTHGELELIYGTIQACGLEGSIIELGKITTGSNAYIVQPSNGMITDTDVRYEPYDGWVLSEVLVIEAPRPDNETPLTIEAMEAATVTITNPLTLTIGYSINRGPVTWTEEAEISVNLLKGGKMEMFGNNKTYAWDYSDDVHHTNVNFSGNCYVFGNIMSLIQADGFETLTKFDSNTNFKNFFKDNTHLFSHPIRRLVLPAMEVKYKSYKSMFEGCTSLTRAPALPAMKLDYACYMQMFSNCSSLTSAPALPATTLASACYEMMFVNCKLLTVAPELLAETLTNSCYYRMFWGCSQLENVTCLALDISATDCTFQWLQGVSSEGTFTKASDEVAWTTGISGIPTGWHAVVDNTKQPCGLSFTADHVDITFNGTYEMPVLVNPHELLVTYSSSDPTVATVDGVGNVNILKAGTATITATFSGSSDYYSGHASYTLTATSAGVAPEFAFAREAVLITYGESLPDIGLTMSDGLTATYSSDNPSVATVSATTGKVTVRGKGVTTITAKTDGSLQYRGATAKYYVIVLANGERVRNDSNNDGKVTITDAVSTVDYILSGKE